MFLDRDVEIDFQDYEGRTALFDAAENGNSEVVELLLERGARADLTDHDGRTPNSIADRDTGYNKVLKLLQATPKE